MKEQKKPGFCKNTPVDVRMKEYESTTDYSLIPRIPVYVRIDGRAFHSFCRPLRKPFDEDFTETIKAVTKYLHEKTNAALSFCQSDEISLCWLAPEKMPFGTRLFKIQSVLAGMASSAFCVFGSNPARSESFRERIKVMIPHFDCRCCQMPIEELANMFVWRSQDSVKNSITQLALAYFSDKQIHGKSGDDKIRMLKDEKGVDYETVLAEDLRLGAFFRREVYEKTLTPDEIAKIPEKSRKFDENGEMKAMRSRISQFQIGMPLREVENKIGVLLNRENPVRKSNYTI